MKYLLLILLTPLLSISCKSQQLQEYNQGIEGYIYWVSGNQMPRIGVGSTGAKKPVVRELYIYNAVKLSDVRQEDGFFSGLPDEPILKISTDEDGHFKVNLPVGTYSIFSSEEGGLWANLFNGEGIINPVVVDKDAFTDYTMDINYKAAY